MNMFKWISIWNDVNELSWPPVRNNVESRHSLKPGMNSWSNRWTQQTPVAYFIPLTNTAILFLSNTMSCLSSTKSGTRCPLSSTHHRNRSVKLAATLCNSYIITLMDEQNSVYNNHDSLFKRRYHKLDCEDLLTHTLTCTVCNLSCSFAQSW